ncbi:unnamed protein product, partial [Closterium sp. NIES-54]
FKLPELPCPNSVLQAALPALPHALCPALRVARLLPSAALPALPHALCPALHAALLAPCSARALPCPAARVPPCPTARAPPCPAARALPCPSARASPCPATRMPPCPTARAPPCPAARAPPCPAACAPPCPAARALPFPRCPAARAPALPAPCPPCCAPHALLPASCPAVPRTLCCPQRAALVAYALPVIPPILVVDADGRLHRLGLWLMCLRLHLWRYIRDGVSLVEHTSGSLPPPPTPAELAADADESQRSTGDPRLILGKGYRLVVLGGGATSGGGGSRGGQQRQQSQQETPSPQQLREWFSQRCVPGSVEATSLGPVFTMTTLGGELVAICTDSRIGAHLVKFTRRPGSGLYTLPTKSAQVAVSGQLAVFCSCQLLTHHTLLWHHRLGHPSPPHLHVEGQQHTAPHSSFPPTIAPLQTLHMDLWGHARVHGQDQERYFLLVVDDYMRYTTGFPLWSKADVRDVLIPLIIAVRRQLRARFQQDLHVQRLHSDRGGEFSSHLLEDCCRAEGIAQSFTLPASPQHNGIAEHRIDLIMEFARTSMIHAAAPHFLWPFAVRYAAHQLNLWLRVSVPEASPTLRWTGEVGDASAFWVLGALSLVRDTTAGKLFPRTLRCGPSPSGVSQVDPPLGEPLEVSSHTSGPAEGGDPAADDTAATRRSPRLENPLGFPPRRSSPPPQPDAIDSGAAGVGDYGGEDSGGAGPGVADSGGAESGVAGFGGAASPSGGGVVGAHDGDSGVGQQQQSPRQETLSPQQLRDWVDRRGRSGAGAWSTGGDGGAGAGGVGGAGAAGARGAGAAGARGAGSRVIGGTGAAGAGGTGAGGAGGAGAGGVGAAGAGVAGAGGTGTGGAGGAGAGGVGAAGARGAGGAGVGGVGAGHPGCTRARGSGTVASSLLDVPDPESDLARAASPAIRLLANFVTDPSFESTAASAFITEIVDFAATCRINYVASLLECLAAAVPHLSSMLLCPEGDPDALDIPTPRSYAEAISVEYSSQWQTSMDAEMASWKSTCTYVDEVPPLGANIVDGTWIFRVKRPPGSPPAFKARYVARGFRRSSVVLTGHSDASWADDQATQRSSQGYSFSLDSGSVSWRSTRLSSVLGSSCEAEIYAGAMAAQELRWLTYLLTDLGEWPCSPPVLYVDKKAMIALCREQRLEHRTKHIALRYFLARELQQRGQLRLAYVTSRTNTADVFTKALGSGCGRPGGCRDHGGRGLGGPGRRGRRGRGRRPGHRGRRADVEARMVSASAMPLSPRAALRCGPPEPGGAEPERVELGGAEPGGAESGGAEPGGAEPERVDCSRAAGATGPAAGAGAAGAAGPGGSGAGGTSAVGGPAGVGAAGGAGAAGPGGACTGGIGAAGAGGAAGVGAVGAEAVATRGAAGAGAAGGTRAGGATGVVARDPGAEGTGAVSAVSGGATRPRPYYQREHESRPASPESHPASPESHPESPVSNVRTGRRVRRQRPPPVPGTHSMTLRPSTAPQCVPLPSPPASSLPDGPDPESDSLRAASPTVTCFLATAVTDPTFESTAASSLVAELVDFAAACRLDYAASLVAESDSASVCPVSVGGECALGTDILEDRQEEFECFAAALPHLVSMLLAPEGDPDAPNIPTPRSYAEAIEGPYSSQWLTAMDTEMASWKSTGTFIDEVPPPGANIVSGMWIFRVKRSPGSPPVFKARYVARGFSQRQGVDFFQIFSPTPKMTTLRVLLHVAAQRDYELHSLDFSTASLQGSLHEEIWLRRPPGFTGTTLAALGFAPSTADPSLFLCTDTTLPPFYVLVYVDDLIFATADTEALAHVMSELQKRHTCTDLGELTSYLGLRITRDRAQRTITLTQSHMVQQVLQRFAFTYSSPQSAPLPTGHSLSAPPSDESVEWSGPYPELVGCLMYLMTCTRPELAYPLSILAHYVAPGRHREEHMDAAKRVLRYLCSTSGMGLVLGGRARVVLTGHADASWAEIYAGAMAAQELRWLTYLLTDLGEAPRSPPVLYVDNKAMIALCQEHRLEHRTKHIALRYFLARELQQRGQLCLADVATRANTADIFTKALQPCDHQRFCTMLGCVHCIACFPLYADPSCFTYNLNHVVLLVGYRLTGSDPTFPHMAPPFWIIRNSWGPEWGDGGHMRMDIQGGDGVCGINTLPGIYPVVRAAADPCNVNGTTREEFGSLFNPCGNFACTVDGSSNRCDCNDPRFGDTCESLAAYFSLTTSCPERTEPCAAAFQALNPGVDCSGSSRELVGSQAVCVERRAESAAALLIPVCSQFYLVQAGETCDQIRSVPSPPLSPLEFFHLNPGIKCSRLVPKTDVGSLTGFEVSLCSPLRPHYPLP